MAGWSHHDFCSTDRHRQNNRRPVPRAGRAQLPELRCASFCVPSIHRTEGLNPSNGGLRNTRLLSTGVGATMQCTSANSGRWGTGSAPPMLCKTGQTVFEVQELEVALVCSKRDMNSVVHIVRVPHQPS